MKLVVAGATGRTGRLVVAQALARGHAVCALVRNERSFPADENLRIVVSSPGQADVLAAALAGHEAVISCLGQQSAGDTTLLRDAARAMLEAMRQSGVRRYLVISQGLLFPSRNPIVFVLRRILGREVADTTAMEDIVRGSAVDWTIARPPRLTDGGTPRGYRLDVAAPPRGAWSMTRADLAAFLVDAAEKRQYVRQIVGLGSA